MSYRYLLFDHDGVLVDTERWYYEATRRALLELDIVLDESSYQEIMVNGQAAWILAEEKGVPAADIDRLKRKRKQCNRSYSQRCKAHSHQFELNQ